MEGTYNGYTNYETWAAALWIDNDEGSQEYWAERAQECWDSVSATQHRTRDRVAVHALVDLLKDNHEENMPEVEGIYADLLSAASSSIDWYDIATNMMGDTDQSDEDDEE